MTIIAAWEQHPRSKMCWVGTRGIIGSENNGQSDITANMTEEERIVVRAGINGHVGKTTDGYENVHDEYGS